MPCLDRGHRAAHIHDLLNFSPIILFQAFRAKSSKNKTGAGQMEGCRARLFFSNRHPPLQAEITFDFFKSVAGAREISLSHRPTQLEREFQSDLHDSLAARAGERIAGREVRR
jgi:hypothetical protein